MGNMFQGLYTSADALRLNQVAISVINNNIANMNTEGYSKQRVDLQQGHTMPGSIDEKVIVPIGGVELETITRYSNNFLEGYLRKEQGTLGYFDQMATSMSFVEGYFNELDETGITGAMTAFYAAAQELSMDPTNKITRSNFLQRAQDLATEFNSSYSRLADYRESLVGDSTTSSLNASQIKTVANEINVKLKEIATLNDDIASLTSQQNIKPNALLDQRDLLINQLSEYIPVNVDYEGSHANIYVGNIKLVEAGEQIAEFGFDMAASTFDNPAVVNITSPDGSNIYCEDYQANFPEQSGQLKALLDIGGDGVNSIFASLQDLDLLAQEFARVVNDIQVRTDATPGAEMTSACIDGSVSPQQLIQATEYIFLNVQAPGVFDSNAITASNIQVNDAVVADPYLVATAYIEADAAPFAPNDPNAIGNNDNAMAFANCRDTSILALGGFNVEDKMASMISEIGSYTSTINNSQDAQSAIVDQINEKKQMEVGVNLDQELMDLVKYQNSYNASARVFSIVNEMMQLMMSLLK